ncbi:hypothetical protein [Ferrithrix thermotolerans]|uniref:hypothetical protein n=1 Tax=Ferrithrix thermotolerans TaxID=209649 RepID=UPI0011609584|nr:hypothetical protein [Ferrithrix thermotolerans]
MHESMLLVALSESPCAAVCPDEVICYITVKDEHVVVAVAGYRSERPLYRLEAQYSAPPAPAP